MHLMLPHKLQIITIVVSVFVYSCNASDGSVVSRLVDHTQSTVHSNRPPEPSTPSTTKNSHHSSSSQQQQQQQQPKDKLEKSKSSYAMLSQAMSEAVHHEFNSLSGSGASPVTEREGSACLLDDADCLNHDKLGMEAIRHLHQQLDDDEDGDITLAESDDFLREELKYESGYEKRHKAFHHNDDLHISVKELWEAWLRSEVHNWTVDQTTEWLAQSVQLPQYVRIFRQHKVTGRVLPLLAVNNMHYVSTVLGIKDPIHKQKIALKAMDAVLFGPPRETGTRWKDLLLVALLLTAIIGSWYAYQQNKNAKFHMRRMAKDMEGLHSAEVALQEMQKELERARVEQENVGKEKLDLERRLKEAPSLKSSDSDLEVQALKQEIEILRNELSRAEGELVDQCYSPPPGLQIWLQLTYELESRAHLKKRIAAEKQLQTAREACEKLRRKRSSLYGAFVSTHGKSIDDVDRSIVEARNALSEVTSELQERTHRWKQIEQMLGFSIMSNNGISYLENVLYNKNGKSMSRARITSSQDDLDDDSVQAFVLDSCLRAASSSRGPGSTDNTDKDSSAGSDETDRDSITFVLGSSSNITPPSSASDTISSTKIALINNYIKSNGNSYCEQPLPPPAPILPRSKKLLTSQSQPGSAASLPVGPSSGASRSGFVPPRRIMSQQSITYGSKMARSQSTDLVALESQPSPAVTPTSPNNNSSGSSIAITGLITPAAAAIQPFSIPLNVVAGPSASAAGTGATGTSRGPGSSRAGTGSTHDVISALGGDNNNQQQLEDASTTDSSSIGGDLSVASSDGVAAQATGGVNGTPNADTKRRRKLHFPFGKKSNKTKVT
ncbi:stromal interaction molecule homolog isoform X1 [Culicoides brevitarsis]|uniref:stromal interaction molecule homolog isoform X1 n=1 Tax=Culicoides brevitarsis TaxID=469753 RepID=UPI00307C9C45